MYNGDATREKGSGGRKKKRKITKKKKENETPGLWSETGEGER